MGGGIRSETVRAAVGTCSRVGLFDKRLLDVEGVLTSKGIQRRFVEATKRRRVRSVISEYWLLSGKESPGIIFEAQKSKICNANEGLRNANGVLRNAESHKSKVKESKVNIKKNTSYSSMLPDGNAPPEMLPDMPPPDRTPYQDVVNLFHDICKSYPRVRALSEKRKKAIKARMKNYSLDDFREVFTKAEASAFLKGANNRNWSADFDWLMCDSNIAKVLEGKYDSKADIRPSYQATAADKYDMSLFDRLANESRGDVSGLH